MDACHIITTTKQRQKKNIINFVIFFISRNLLTKKTIHTYKSRKRETRDKEYTHKQRKSKLLPFYVYCLLLIYLNQYQCIDIQMNDEHCLSTKWKKSHIEINEQSNNSMLIVLSAWKACNNRHRLRFQLLAIGKMNILTFAFEQSTLTVNEEEKERKRRKKEKWTNKQWNVQW